MHRDARLYLDDILEAIGKIRDYTAGMGYAAFTEDAKTQDAVIRTYTHMRYSLRTRV